MANITESFYLKNVHLAGFKSIEDVNIGFEHGLNIIIGKNAAGKTNFLKFLNQSLGLDYEGLSDFKSELLFGGAKSIQIQSSGVLNLDDLFTLQKKIKPNVKSVLKIDGKTVRDKKDGSNSIAVKIEENKVFFEKTFLCHGIPKEYFIVDKPYSFKIEAKSRVSTELFTMLRDVNTPYFIKTILGEIFTLTVGLNYSFEKENDLKLIKDKFINLFKIVEKLNQVLKTYTPITEIRISENFNIHVSEDKEILTLNNLFLEFKIDSDWLPFSSLSDGTRRIFYIISELYDIHDEGVRIRHLITSLQYSPKVPRIILIEEPELGIHPHQFSKLMDFIKEQSETSQIIMSTHSPQSLDIFEKEELNRIIIGFNSKEEGTKLRHLNNAELEKAYTYIEDEFLSDYWLYSDLEQ